MFRRLFAAGLALAAAAAAVPAQPPAAAAPPAGLDAVPRDGFLVASVDVAKLWDQPGLKGAFDWLAAAPKDGQPGPVEQLVGVAPADLARVTVYVPHIDRHGDPLPVVMATTRRPFNEARLVKNLIGDAGRPQRVPADPFGRSGNLIRLPEHGPFRVAVLADERTIILVPESRGGPDGGSAAVLVARLLARKADGPLAPALAAAPGSAVSVGLDPRMLGMLEELPPYAALFRAASATLTADVAADGLKAKLTLTFPDAADARRAGPVLEEGMADLAKTFDREAKRAADRGDRGALEGALFAAGRDVLRSAKVEVKDKAVVAAADGLGADAVAKLIAALPKQVAAARRNVEAQNNLKQILLGLHAHHDVMGYCPGDVGPDRKAAMSWRVAILPYIEQAPLYQQLDLKQAWDSPRNKAVLEKAEMPKVFEVPGRPAAKGHTYWRSFSLPKKAQAPQGGPWLTEGQVGPRMADITDGTSNTFAVVEAGEAVPWYAPDVLAYDGARPLPPLGEKGGDGFLAGMGDGSVRFVRAGTDEKALRAAITRNGGEVLGLPDR